MVLGYINKICCELYITFSFTSRLCVVCCAPCERRVEATGEDFAAELVRGWGYELEWKKSTVERLYVVCCACASEPAWKKKLSYVRESIVEIVVCFLCARASAWKKTVYDEKTMTYHTRMIERMSFTYITLGVLFQGVEICKKYQ